MNLTEAKQKLQTISQEHLLCYWSTLSDLQQQQLLRQIDSLHIPTFDLQQETLKNKKAQDEPSLEVFDDFALSGNQEDLKLGQKLIAEGRAGCLIVAGGQGTRLGFDGPKGLYPISVIKKKSLFQLFAEKAAAASKKYCRPLPIAIMTSPQNHALTETFFSQHNFFGLNPSQIAFFCQGTLPFLENQGNLFLETPSHIAEGPDGNGSSIHAFLQSGLWNRWHHQDIQHVLFVQIDNPLADPFDAELVGFHTRNGNEISIKSIPRNSPHEKVGIIVKKKGKIEVVEYSEMAENEKLAANADGTLKHLCANISLYCFEMAFIRKVEQKKMPLHLAHKAVQFLNQKRLTIQSKVPNAWKFERFIFDVLPLSSSINVLVYPREQCFSPLKNTEGVDSPEQVQSSLQYLERITIEKVTGQIAPSHAFELSPEFYYPTAQLLQKWQGKTIPDIPYINP
jgi:UDP-N-acetylglucosamine/UDP-N-acetylgalactosamine diphosphorylase